ncbi:MAG: hypothetical protein FIA95_08025 [Gemmatimonadetes bacterium]|nr:hypothetical protein [Gemmatimonadota bacterium]
MSDPRKDEGPIEGELSPDELAKVSGGQFLFVKPTYSIPTLVSASLTLMPSAPTGEVVSMPTESTEVPS